MTDFNVFSDICQLLDYINTKDCLHAELMRTIDSIGTCDDVFKWWITGDFKFYIVQKAKEGRYDVV